MVTTQITMPNVHVSSHPVLRAKLSYLRSSKVQSARIVRSLVAEISSVLAIESSAQAFHITNGDSELLSHMGTNFTPEVAVPDKYALVPILRAGLSMVDAFLNLLPEVEAPVYHLGIFRDKSSLLPIEYYSKLPNLSDHYDIVYVLDPIIATGGTAAAAIQLLMDWGAKKIVLCSMIASAEGIKSLADQFPETDFYIGAIDSVLSSDGYLLPGIGDIGDRLHSTFDSKS